MWCSNYDSGINQIKIFYFQYINMVLANYLINNGFPLENTKHINHETEFHVLEMKYKFIIMVIMVILCAISPESK